MNLFSLVLFSPAPASLAKHYVIDVNIPGCKRPNDKFSRSEVRRGRLVYSLSFQCENYFRKVTTSVEYSSSKSNTSSGCEVER